MWALIDCNNFYVSCERVFRPDLKGKPVVVLSNNDGCFISRSNEAKAIGIPMGAPAFEYEEFIQQYKVTVFSANFTLYGDLSNRIMSILKEYAPEVEIYSIDEAFLKLDGMSQIDLKSYAEEIQKRVYKWTGVPISIGIAPTKALTKVANKIAKKFYKRTGYIYIIDSEEKRLKALKWMDIGDVWGIGRQYAKLLKSIKMNTAYDFTTLPDSWVKHKMTVLGLRLKHDLEGIANFDIEKVQAKRNIATTRSFEKNYTELSQIKERVVTFAVSCAEKLRKQNSCCNAMMIFIHSNGNRKDLPQYSRNCVIELPYPTNSNIELAQFASLVIEKIFKPGYHYKKAGVIVMELTPADKTQLSLFINSNPKHISLMQAMDKINAQFGQHKIKLASQNPKRMWTMKQEKLSPRYTTNIDDIITVHA